MSIGETLIFEVENPDFDIRKRMRWVQRLPVSTFAPFDPSRGSIRPMLMAEGGTGKLRASAGQAFAMVRVSEKEVSSGTWPPVLNR
jgi:hypothetical protein